MRMEKGFLHWKADLITEYDPFETGLARFVKLDKGDFMGRDALLRRQAEGPRRRLVSLRVQANHAPARAGASLMQGDRVVGTVSSGDWGHRVGMNLAYAFVRPDLATEGTDLELDLCGDRLPVTVIAPSPFDPEGGRMRG